MEKEKEKQTAKDTSSRGVSLNEIQQALIVDSIDQISAALRKIKKEIKN